MKLNMKKTFFILTLCTLMMACSSTSQNDKKTDENSKLSLDDKIKDIREKFKTIENNQNKYNKKKFDLDCGTITYFYDGNDLRKVSFGRIGGDSEISESYYYWDDQVIFIFWVILQGGGGAVTNVPDLEYRFYYYNSKPIRFMENQNIIAVEKANHNPNEAYSEGISFIDAYNAKDFGSLCDK